MLLPIFSRTSHVIGISFLEWSIAFSVSLALQAWVLSPYPSALLPSQAVVSQARGTRAVLYLASPDALLSFIKLLLHVTHNLPAEFFHHGIKINMCWSVTKAGSDFFFLLVFSGKALLVQ